MLKLKNTKNLPTNFQEGSVVMDPDLIDLTMIPPPMTPDEVGTAVFLVFSHELQMNVVWDSVTKAG